MIATTPLPLFLFYLVNPLGESYFIDGNGLLQKSGLPAPLGFSPDGWQSIAIGWERNLQKFGLIRNFSIELGFPGDGALILEKILDNGNPDSKVSLLVQRRELEVTDDDYALTHKFYYKGEIDLSTYDHVRRIVKVKIMEGGRSKEIAANQATIYNIPVTDNAKRIRVQMDGLNYKQTAKFIMPAVDVDFAVFNQCILPVSLINRDQASANGVALFTCELKQHGGGPTYNFALEEDFFMKTPDVRTIRVFGRFKGNCSGQCSIWLVGSSAPISTFTEPNLYHVEGFITGDFDRPFDVTINLPAGEQLYFYHNGLFFSSHTVFEQTDINIEFRFQYRNTFIYALKPKDTFDAFVEKVCGDATLGVSSLLEGSGICTTSGDAIRGLPGAFIKSTFQVFTDAWSILKCAGIGVEKGKIILERRAHFLRDDYIVDLGEVKDHSDIVAADIMFNTVLYGYVDQNYSDVNGRYETNSQQLRSSPVQRVVKALQLISQIRADAVGIDLTRMNLEGKISTDANSDNDTFFLNVDLATPFNDLDGIYYKLKRVAYTSVSGVPDNFNLFNIEELTPRRIFKEWEPYFAGCFSGYTGKMVLTDAKKNKDLVTTGGPGGTITEAEDVIIENMGPAMFKNRELLFTAVTKSAIVQQLNDNPWALFRYTKNGESFKGYLLKGAVMSKTNEEQDFVLISHKDNDLTLLENE